MTLALRQTDVVLDDSGYPVVNGYFYVGTYQTDPVANPISLYSDVGLTVPIANPQRTDSYGRPENDIYISFSRYSYLIKNSAGTTIEGPKDRVPFGNASQVALDQGGSVQDAIQWATPDVSGEDASTAIQAALDTGRNVLINQSCDVGSTLTFSSTQRQQLCTVPGAVIYPTFDGDVVRMIAAFQRCCVFISGNDGANTQPRTGTAGGGIVIGYGGANATQASVAGSSVENFYGTGYVWEQGALVDFSGSRASLCTVDGYRATENYNDNNHGFFAHTHAVNCTGIGYNIKGVGAVDDVLNSRHHVFEDAKGFGCGQNFSIETISNIGSVFSEDGVSPDSLGSFSRGNYIQVIETDAAYQAFVDSGTGNVVAGYSSYDQWEAKNWIVNQLDINARYEGRRKLTQTADRTFSDTLSNTTGNVTVTRAKGSAAKRTDIFEDRVQLNGGGVINRAETASGTLNFGASVTTASNATASITVANIGAGDSALVTLVNVPAGVFYSSSIPTGGGSINVRLRNESGSTLDLSAVTYRYWMMKHFA